MTTEDFGYRPPTQAKKRRPRATPPAAPGQDAGILRSYRGRITPVTESTDVTEDETTANPSPRRVLQRGLWFEEFETGVVYDHRPGRTVTEADNVLFTTLTMNTQALHLDAAYSVSTQFHARLVNSMWTLSTLVGLSVAQLTQGTIVANLGFSEISFPRPLFHGDTLYAETTITDTRESKSRLGEGVVTFAHTGRNQDGVVVAIAVRKTLVRKRPS